MPNEPASRRPAFSRAECIAYIRKMWPSNVCAQDIGAAIGMRRNAVTLAGRRHGLGPRPWIKPGPPINTPLILNADQIATVKEMRADGRTFVEIGDRLQIPSTTLCTAVRRAGLAHLLARKKGQGPRKKLGRHTKWTDEREALFKKLWPTDMPTRDVMQELNNLAGVRLSSRSTLYLLAERFGLDRPLHAPRTPTGPRVTVWSEERDQILVVGWPMGVSQMDLAKQVSALPGPAATDKAVENRVRRLRLLRSPQVQTRRTPKTKPAAVALPPARPASWVRSEPAATSARLSGQPMLFNYAKHTQPAPFRVDVPDEPIVLPAPCEDGRIEMQLLPLMRWCRQQNIQGFDGGNMDRLNALRDRQKLPRFVVIA